uniref:TonB-dependent receptor plug domain-containing protein n=1 Tax=Altererythrobacter segetis TaxID=1104773 RepID=UPI001FB02173|nr:TonB-dependent receptor [Altererythrobacter segetis]
MSKYLIFGLSFATSTPAVAQDREEITITATGAPIDVEDTGQPVTLIGRDEIDAVQGADLTRVLARAPGVTFSRNGAPGSFTGVRVRGAEAEQLLVLIDGVRVADPSAPGGGFDFGNLLAGNIGKIDLLRSSNSTIWGSDAIGGVLAISTRSEQGIQASGEYGARDTAFGTVSGGVGGDRASLAGAASWYLSDGFSSAAGGSEPDGFEEWDVSAQSRVAVTSALSAFVRGRYAKGRLDLDGFPAPDFVLADTDETQRTRQWSGAAGATYDASALHLTAAYSVAGTVRRTFDPTLGTAPTFTSEGHGGRVDVTGEWRPTEALRFNFGGDYKRTRLETLFDAAERTHAEGVYAQIGIETGKLSAHAGARRDDHARFGGATSFGADVSYALTPDLRLRASAGEGFKAPTLFQLLSDYGNTALRPERSTSVDLALAWRQRNALPYASATAFRRDSDNLIDFVSCFGTASGICANRPFGTYDNVGRVRAQGVEIEAGAELSPGLSVRLAYSLVDTENRTPGSPNRGNALARRPRHTLSLGGEWQVVQRGPSLGADLRLVSKSFDDAANTVPLGSYAVLDLTARWPVSERVEIFGRIENAANERYQTAAGYASAPRGAFLGARMRV